MNPKLIITLILSISVSVALFIYFQFSPSNPPLVTEIATSTVPSTAGEPIVYPTIPSPLTLASLQALPDWNPTMAVEGMKRVEDNNPELEVKNLPIHIEEITSNNSSSTFVVKYLEPEVSAEACEKYGLTGEPSGYLGGYICLISTPDLFNELIILSGNTGEVLHKYRLEEGYSLARLLYFAEGGILAVSGSSSYRYLYMHISGWDFSSSIPKETSVYYNYRINLLTGEITEIKPR